jgi:hypothetical protein
MSGGAAIDTTVSLGLSDAAGRALALQERPQRPCAGPTVNAPGCTRSVLWGSHPWIDGMGVGWLR